MSKYWQSLSESEQRYSVKTISTLQKMRDQRERPDREKNNLSYSQSYDLNREADLAYSDLSLMLPSDNNGGDDWAGTSSMKRYEMTSGSTRSKDTTLVSHLNSFEFSPDIVAFDKDNKIVNDLGENTEDLIIRSLEMEQWENRQIDPQREFISQGNVFIREVLQNKYTVIHDNGDWKAGMPVNKYEKDQNSITKCEMCFERQLILGKNVYLGSIRERDIQKQTQVAIWEEMSFEKAEQIYGTWDRWDYVKATKGKTFCSRIESIVAEDAINTWSTENYWNLVQPDDELGILHVYNSVKKTYMIFINGIMMLPVGYSLYEVSPSGLIPIAKGDAEIIPGYSYAKGIPANTLVDTKMYDMVWNAMAQKMSQSAHPTMSNHTGHMISQNMLYSGSLINGLRPNGLMPVLPETARTIQPSETTFLEYAKQIISDKSVDDTFSAQNVDVKTATELLERKKATALKLFSLIDGWKNLEKQLARLRIASIFSKWTQPEQVPYYKDITKIVDGVEQVIGRENIPSFKNKYKEDYIQTKFKDSGQDGIRHVRFVGPEDQVPDPSNPDQMDAMAKEEDMMTKKHGKPTRISYIRSEKLARLFDWYWYIDIRQSRDDDSHLDLMMYIDAKTRVSQLFPNSLNKDYTLQKIAKIQHEDVDKAYMKENPAQALTAGAQPQSPGGAAVPNPMTSVA